MINKLFRQFSTFVASQAGKPRTFVLAISIICLWAVSGPIFDYSNTWQLMINTMTTVVTFLMVFLIQNTQNRDSKAVHLKLDEILRSMRTARNQLVDIEQAEDGEMEHLQQEFEKLHHKYMKQLEYREAKKSDQKK